MSDLFKEFNPIDEKQWKAQVQAELKGADFAETLVSESAEGFQIKPLYSIEDAAKSSFITTENNWKIISEFIPSFTVAYDSVDGIWLNSEQISEFKAIDNELLFVNYANQFPEIKAMNANTWLSWDFLGDLAEFGNYPEQSKEESVAILKKLKTSNYNNSLSINTARWQNAGANHAEQLALMLLAAHEYAVLTEDAGILNKILLRTATGGNFFFEIAKLRAARILLANLAKYLNTDIEVKIMAESSLRNKSLMDKYNNIIRSTYEAAAGIFGNADFVNAGAYDELFIENKEMPLELGFKQQFVLREESFLNHYADPLKGSYYVEFLTGQLAGKAWELFKRLEGEGGYLEGLKSEKIQHMISASATKEKEKFDNGKLNLIGVNKFPKKDDDFVNFKAKDIYLNTGKTLYKTVRQVRLAEKAEKTYAEN